MVTSLTSLPQLPCEDICWKILELSLLTTWCGTCSLGLTAHSDLAAGWLKSCLQKDLWAIPLTSSSTGISRGSSHAWTLCIHLEWVSRVTVHHLLDRFYFKMFYFLSYDYKTLTIWIQNDNPSQYCTGIFLLFYFSLSISALILNSCNIQLNYKSRLNWKCILTVKVDIFKKKRKVFFWKI